MMQRLILFLSLACGIYANFEVPDAKVEVLLPQGFSVSIPDIKGIKLFAFHGNINEEMNGREGGTFARDITKAKNGRWAFIDKHTKLNAGDTIYYWTYVDYFDGQKRSGYPKDDQIYNVTEEAILNARPINALNLIKTTIDNANFEVPDAKVEVLLPQGFSVSIPDIKGIKLFAFHGNINEEMNGREGGTFSRDITKAKNGRWAFIDKHTKLNAGDTIYYWIYVNYFDGQKILGYPKDDQIYNVTEEAIRNARPINALNLIKTTIVNANFEVPDAKVEVLLPQGFSVSIPDIKGIKLFAFHGNINEEMNGREGGTFARDITKAKNGRWAFIDKHTKLNAGDTIYYWTYVDYFDGQKRSGYPKDDQIYNVTEEAIRNARPINALNLIKTTIDNANFEVPDAKVEVLLPQGFSVSIPDIKGIKLFAFHGNINEEMNGREGGTFARDITKAKNGRWAFIDKHTKLNAGDTIYYWTYVDYFDGQKRSGYPKDDQIYNVTEEAIRNARPINELILIKTTTDNKAPTPDASTSTVKPPNTRCHNTMESDKINKLSNSELQRYVLLEQLSLIYLQKQEILNKLA